MHGFPEKPICFNKYLSLLLLNEQLMLDLFIKEFCIWIQLILKGIRTNVFLQDKCHIKKLVILCQEQLEEEEE